MPTLEGAFDQKEQDGVEAKTERHSLASMGVSYKRQHYAPRLRKFTGTVQACMWNEREPLA